MGRMQPGKTVTKLHTCAVISGSQSVSTFVCKICVLNELSKEEEE